MENTQNPSMPAKTKTILFILFLVLISVRSGSPPAALAQSETAYDLVDAVNALRASQGLEPYRVDPWLMAYAQEHSDYQAATHTSTHLHSDGTLPQSIGLQENVAGGDNGYVTVAVVVNEIWVDWGHRHILTGYASGDIGAGITLSDNGQLYYTVNIRPGDEPTTGTAVPATAVPFIPLTTSTPNRNGAVIHVVREGQALWSIAQSYGVTIEEVCRLNGMAVDSTLIYPGQELLIRAAAAVTSTPPGETPSTPAPTPKNTSRPFTETAAPSPSFTLAPTGIPLDMPRNNRGIGLAIVLTGVVGVLIIVIFGFRKSQL